MARPLQDVHRQDRRVGHLQEEDLLARDRRDRRGIVAERQRVEAVEDQPQVRVVRPFDDRPGLPVAADVAAPGQRLVADAQVAPRRPFRELVKLRGAPLRVVEALRRGVRADQHRRGAERLHDVELALGPIEVAGVIGVGHAFEIAKRLVQVDRQSQVRGHRPQVGGTAVEIDEVGLEQLDPVEAGGGDRLQLLAERSAHRHRGDRSAHGGSVQSPSRATERSTSGVVLEKPKNSR